MVGQVQPSARALAALSLLASLGSLAEAADRLGVTRSALSHRIAELEKILGTALVRKQGRRLKLTEEGERLLASMGDALERLEAAVQPFQRDRSSATAAISGFRRSRPSPRIG
jgi:DNA-binding transcriptional LysR family regulator